jgi:hypothetical protein
MRDRGRATEAIGKKVIHYQHLMKNLPLKGGDGGVGKPMATGGLTCSHVCRPVTARTAPTRPHALP